MQEIHDGLDFSLDYDNREFSIFSVKFSTDGRELVAGTNDNDYAVYVYDLEANKANLRIPAHSVSREISFSNCWDKAYDLSPLHVMLFLLINYYCFVLTCGTLLCRPLIF